MGLNAEINVVSLIDVMMLLMVIFMITAPIMQGGVDVRLPKADARPIEAKAAMIVTVKADGMIHVENDQAGMTREVFRASFKTLAGNRIRDGVYLKADARASWETVAHVLATLQRAGVEKLDVLTEPES
jgi:biopolymer transport protein ExbD